MMIIELKIVQPDENFIPPDKWKREGVIVTCKLVPGRSLQSIQQQGPTQLALCLCNLYQITLDVSRHIKMKIPTYPEW